MSTSLFSRIQDFCAQIEYPWFILCIFFNAYPCLPFEANLSFWLLVIFYNSPKKLPKIFSKPEEHKDCSKQPKKKKHVKSPRKISIATTPNQAQENTKVPTRAEPIFAELPRNYEACTGNRMWIDCDDSFYAVWISNQGTLSREIICSVTQLTQYLKEILPSLQYLKSIDFISLDFKKSICRSFLYSQLNVKTVRFTNCVIKVKPDLFRDFFECLHFLKFLSRESSYDYPELLSDEMFSKLQIKLELRGTNDCSRITDGFLHNIEDCCLPSFENCRTGFTVAGILDRIKNQIHPESNSSINFGIVRAPRTKNLSRYLTTNVNSIKSGKKLTIDRKNKEHILVEITQSNPKCTFKFKIMKPRNFKI